MAITDKWFVARFNFSCSLIGNRTQAATRHSATVFFDSESWAFWDEQITKFYNAVFAE